MMEMRELTRLYLCFKDLSGESVKFEDMHKRKNLTLLVNAFNKLGELNTSEQKEEKYGLKVNLNGIFQKNIKSLRGHYAGIGEDEEHKEIKKFKEAYNDRLLEFLSKARYNTNKNSLKKALLPKNLPQQTDITN